MYEFITNLLGLTLILISAHYLFKNTVLDFIIYVILATCGMSLIELIK